MQIITESTLSCPYCGYKETMTMPEQACLYYHECSHCKKLISPLAGDCCVFCSYGTVPCPSIQKTNADGQCC